MAEGWKEVDISNELEQEVRKQEIATLRTPNALLGGSVIAVAGIEVKPENMVVLVAGENYVVADLVSWRKTMLKAKAIVGKAIDEERGLHVEEIVAIYGLLS